MAPEWMRMLDKLKKILSFSDGKGIDVSRRKFIKDAGSLAALTVAAVNIPSLLKVKEIQEQISMGLVENQTFYLDEPIHIEIDGVTIRNCTFVANRPLPYMVNISANNTTIRDCHFESAGSGACIRVEPDAFDSTGRLQDALDAASSNRGMSEIRLTSGNYRVASPIQCSSTKIMGASALDAGQTVKLSGYYANGDGGAARYAIKRVKWLS